MENFKPKPESKSKQESDRCRRLRVGLHDEFRADKLVRFTPELRAKGKVLSEEFGKLYTKEKGISFEEWFKKIKMFDRKEGVTEFRVLHEQERLNKLKDSKRIKRAMSEKNKQKEVIKKGSKPGNAQADNEITKNANPEESVDAKEPEEADPKKTKAEQKNQEPELEEEAFKMGEADEDKDEDVAEEENAEPNQEPEIIPEVENIDDEKITEPNQEPEIAQDIKKLKAEQEDRVLGALDQAISFIEKTQEEKRTEQEKWIIETIGDSWLKMNEDGKILVGGSDGFGNGNKKFIKYEGIPVDELIDYLKKRYSGNLKETEKLKKVVKILEDNSVPFHSDSAEELDERIKLEGYYISQEENYRKKTSQEENYFEGKKALSKRRELVFLTEEQIRASIKANHTNKTQKKEAQEDIDQLDAGNISKSGDEELKQETAKKQKTEELKQETVEVDDELDEIIGKTELDKTGIIREQEKTVEIDDELDEIIGKTELDKTKIESETNPEPEENEEGVNEQVEIDEKLNAFECAVKDAREIYVKKDYEVTNIYKRISKVLGSFFQNKVYENPDIKIYHDRYIQALKDLKDYKIELIREKYADLDSLSDEEKADKEPAFKCELNDLVKQFNCTEKLDLIDTRTNARAIAIENETGGKILKIMGDTINAYRKLGWGKKLAISTILLLGGAGATMAATAGVAGSVGLVAFVGTLKMGQRILGGAAAGVGVVGMQETISRKRDQKKALKDKNEILKSTEKFDSLKEKLDSIDKDLQKELGMYEAVFEREKRKAKNRKIIGFGAGMLVGSGAVAWIMHAGCAEAFDHSETVAKATGYVKGVVGKASDAIEHGLRDTPSSKLSPSIGGMEEKFGMDEKFGPKKINIDSAKTNLRVGPLKPDANTTDFKMPDNKIPTEKLIPGSVDKMIDGVEVGAKIPELEVEIPKDSNIEQELIKRMQELKIPKAEAGKYAHRMVEKLIAESKELAGLDPTGKIKPFTLNELNKVKIGEMIKFNIDPNNLDNSSISNFRHINIPHTEGIAVDDIKMSAISEQMNQEEISRKFNDQLFGKAKTIDINPENMPDPRGGLMPDTSISDFSELDSHMDKFPDNMSDTSSANLENIESNLADGARGADNSVADFSLQDNHIDNVADIQGIEISLAEKVNIEKIAGIFDSSLFSGNSLSQQIMETKNLKGVDFYRAYREIYTKIINNTFSENGIIGQDANEYLERSSNSKIDALIKYNSDHFGTQSVEPKSGENMGAWMTRMVDRALGSCGIGLNNGQIKV